MKFQSYSDGKDLCANNEKEEIEKVASCYSNMLTFGHHCARN